MSLFITSTRSNASPVWRVERAVRRQHGLRGEEEDVHDPPHEQPAEREQLGRRIGVPKHKSIDCENPAETRLDQ